MGANCHFLEVSRGALGQEEAELGGTVAGGTVSETLFVLPLLWLLLKTSRKWLRYLLENTGSE